MKEGRASRTAEYVAFFRAIETMRPANRRLFEDRFAERFLGLPLAAVVTLSRLPGAADLISRFIDRRWAGARSSAVARTRLIDDTLIEALTAGAEQVVILGAGFDCRAYRLRELAGLAVFEVDHPDTQMRKRAVLRRASVSIPPSVRFVATDFRAGDLKQKIAAAGFSKAARTFILWEGVTPYLTEPAVDETLRWCAQAAAGSQLLFTYLDRAVLDDPAAFEGTDRLFSTLKAADEEWTFGLRPTELTGYLQQRGLELQQDIGSADYRARYLPEPGRVTRGYEFYRLAIAQVP